MNASDLYHLRRLQAERESRRLRTDDYTGARTPVDREEQGQRRIARRSVGKEWSNQ